MIEVLHLLSLCLIISAQGQSIVYFYPKDRLVSLVANVEGLSPAVLGCMSLSIWERSENLAASPS